MKVNINKNECIHCGTCVSLCPEVFELNKDNISSVKKNTDLEKNKECIKQAITSCPSGVITIEE